VIFEPELETMPREELERLQLKRLGLESLDDLRLLPFTRKDDLREAYPLGRIAVPRDRLRRISASSGTTGKPTVVAYTDADLDVFARVVARVLAAAGAEPGMTLHNAYGYGLFTGGLGFHDGGGRLGLAVVPVSGGMTERQLTLIQDLLPDVLACTPSYALTLAQAFAERGVSPGEISLRIAMLGAEPWTEAMRGEIDAGLGLRAVNVYGLSEIIGPGVAGECAEERAGLHVNEDHFLPEIVDPRERRAGRGRGARRARAHDVHERGAAARPLLDGRHYVPRPQPVQLRAHVRAHVGAGRQGGRHAHHPRRERLPQPGRGDPPRAPRAQPELPPRHRTAPHAR